ncbi:MAG: hypothetical protein ACI4RP_07680, partial [Acutalibacteraceae bacterium]
LRMFDSYRSPFLLILAYYDLALDALKQGAEVNALVSLPVREQIGRYKYTVSEKVDEEYKAILETLEQQINEQIDKGGEL